MYLGTNATIYISTKFKYACEAAILENQLRAIGLKLCTYIVGTTR
jgi:hypothetical protein